MQGFVNTSFENIASTEQVTTLRYVPTTDGIADFSPQRNAVPLPSRVLWRTARICNAQHAAYSRQQTTDNVATRQQTTDNTDQATLQRTPDNM